ncbi:MAG TPA: hypothetical protein VIJ92_03845 [Ginsengibacter sp.]
MKTILIILASLMLGFGASAQRKGGYYHAYRPRVIVSPSVGFGFGYGYPYLGYPYYGYPYGYQNPYGYRGTPYKLSLEIQSIKIDYKNQIRDARHNKSLSHSQKRQEIRSLKSERDQAIISAQQNFRYGNTNNQNRMRRNNNQNPDANNQFQDNGNSSSGSNP